MRLLPMSLFVILLLGIFAPLRTSAQQDIILPCDAPYSDLFAGSDADVTLIVYTVETDSAVVVNPRRAAQRFAPYSTFKIFNALVALDSGAMSDVETQIAYDAEQYPLFDLPNEFPFDEWRNDHNLRTGIQYSVVWFYTEVARLIGQETMQQYLDAMPYGNADASAWIDERQFWLGNGLEISAWEQIDFLRRFLADDLPFSSETVAAVREILILDATEDYIYSGKTGTAASGGLARFVGYLEFADETIIFAINGEITPTQRNQWVDALVEHLTRCR